MSEQEPAELKAQADAAFRQLADTLAEAGLPPGVVRELMARARPAWKLTPRASEEAPVGATRLGGAPDLPPDELWPEWKGRRLAFVAQVNLAEVKLPNLQGALDLPANGLLSFFYDVEELPGGYAAEHRGSARVLYSGDRPVARRATPEGVQVYDAFALERDLTWSLPLLREVPEHERAPVPEPHRAAYEALREEQEWFAEEIRLGGYHDQFQGDMQFEVAAASEGGDIGTSEGWRRAELRAPDTRPWRLLLQLPGKDEAGMEWEDAGVLYFWIREDDLRQRKFDDIWAVLHSG